jgi:hypothetical protein
LHEKREEAQPLIGRHPIEVTRGQRCELIGGDGHPDIA